MISKKNKFKICNFSIFNYDSQLCAVRTPACMLRMAAVHAVTISKGVPV